MICFGGPRSTVVCILVFCLAALGLILDIHEIFQKKTSMFAEIYQQPTT